MLYSDPSEGRSMVIRASGLRAESVLYARIQRLTRDLGRAKMAVNALPPVLRQRVVGGLETEITSKEREVTADLDDPVRAGTIHSADAWARLHALSMEVTTLLEECLL